MYHAPRYDRELLLGEKRDQVLTLDLDRTQPPVAEAVDAVTGVLGGCLLLFAVQVCERTEPASRAALTSRFA